MIETGSTVKVHYTGTLNDGSVFDSSDGGEPLEFQVGSGKMIRGFEAAVRQMEVGTTRTITIPCAEAYGEVRPEMIGTIPREQFPEDFGLQAGKSLELETPQGLLAVRVKDVQDEGVTIDGNHPLAGQDLTFELKLVAVS